MGFSRQGYWSEVPLGHLKKLVSDGLKETSELGVCVSLFLCTSSVPPPPTTHPVGFQHLPALPEEVGSAGGLVARFQKGEKLGGTHRSG